MLDQMDARDTDPHLKRRPEVYQKYIGHEVSRRTLGRIYFFSVRHGIGDLNLLRMIHSKVITVDAILKNHQEWKRSSKK